ncbi:MAG: type II toxin-antitoxin system Phd/YefM family antitoxin [Spirochaetaceae bacterium]|nr:type II toxin-antitoxin system Phd/YefM family antitoxin [Spirochaetaceae bacterium]
MSRTSIYEARNSLSALIKQAESGNLVELTRHEKPVAVLLGYEEYLKNYQSHQWFQNLRKSYLEEVFSLQGDAVEGTTDSCSLDEEGLPFVRSNEGPDAKKSHLQWSFLEEL